MIICYGNPAKSLALAREKMNAEDFARFEREFNDFCVVQGLERWMYQVSDAPAWIKWAFFQGRRYGVGTADHRVADAHYERLAIAMMDDEQAERSLERWMGRGE